MAQRQLTPRFSTEKLASLLECLLLGYAVIEFTSEYHQLWNHQDDFLEHAVQMILFGSIASDTFNSPPPPPTAVADLPA